MGTSILISLGLVIAVAVIALSAFIAFAMLMRLLRERAARRVARDAGATPDSDNDQAS